MFIVLPILLIATLASFQFGTAMLIQQSIEHTATVCAREAGKGADADQLVDVADAVLAAHDLEIGDKVSLLLEAPPLPPQNRGDYVIPPPVSPVLNNGEVRVTISVDMSQKPFLNVLGGYGLSFNGKRFTISGTVKAEPVSDSLLSP